MGVAMTLKNYLDSNDFEYKIIEHLPTSSSIKTSNDSQVTNDKVAKPILLGDDDSYLLAVIPASHRLDIDRLNQAMARAFVIMNKAEQEIAFNDCEGGFIPPTGELYGVDTIIDPALLDKEDVYFESGDHNQMVHMSGEDFRRLVHDAQKHTVSHHL